MTKEIWINLPVKDLRRSKAFFTALGFAFSERDANSEVSAAMLIGTHNTVVMLFSEHLFRGFTQHPISDTGKGTEMMISIDAESREEVDELARKVTEAGGTVFAQPGESQGWMYGCGFCDPDGHRWNVLHMDMSKMPKM